MAPATSYDASQAAGQSTGCLFVVATPIGNLADITKRALDALSSADVVLAEDTRVTGKLLAAFDIHATLERCDENVIAQRSARLVQRMLAGETMAFCSDAGMPGVSDPGLVLVDAAREAGVAVEVLPGASAVPTALVAAGFAGTAFYFGGFLPRKKRACKELLTSLKKLDAALVFYESPHRVAASAAIIAEVFGTRRMALCRELTKVHEEVLRLPADEMARELAQRDAVKGEIALVIAPPARGEKDAVDEDALDAAIRGGLADGTKKSALAKQLSHEFGVSKNELYARMLEME